METHTLASIFLALPGVVAKSVIMPLSFCFLSVSLSCQSKHSSSPSSSSNVIQEIAKPPAPEEFTAKADFNKIILEWAEVEGASSYNVYWATEPEVTKKSMAIERLLTVNAIHSFLNPSNTYYYRVSAIGTGGEGDLSVEISAKPNATVPIPNPSPESRSSGFNCTINGAGDAVVFISNACQTANFCVYTSMREDNNLWGKPIKVSGKIANFAPLPRISNENSLAFATPEGVVYKIFKNGNWLDASQLGKSVSQGSIGFTTSGDQVIWVDKERALLSASTAPNPIDLGSADAAFLSGDGSTAAFYHNGKSSMRRYVNDQWDPAIDLRDLELLDIAGDGKTFVFKKNSRTIEILTDGGASFSSQEIFVDNCCDPGVDLSDGGTRLVFRNYVYRLTNNQWLRENKAYANVAYMPSLSHDGKRVCFQNNGFIYVVEQENERWGHLNLISPSRETRLGRIPSE